MRCEVRGRRGARLWHLPEVEVLALAVRLHVTAGVHLQGRKEVRGGGLMHGQRYEGGVKTRTLTAINARPLLSTAIGAGNNSAAQHAAAAARTMRPSRTAAAAASTRQLQLQLQTGLRFCFQVRHIAAADLADALGTVLVRGPRLHTSAREAGGGQCAARRAQTTFC